MTDHLIIALDEIRDNRKITKKDLCAAADISPDYYSKVLAGKHAISLPVFMQIADYLGFNVTISLKIEGKR